jgi:hypothetical protein
VSSALLHILFQMALKVSEKFSRGSSSYLVVVCHQHFCIFCSKCLQKFHWQKKVPIAKNLIIKLF